MLQLFTHLLRLPILQLFWFLLVSKLHHWWPVLHAVSPSPDSAVTTAGCSDSGQSSVIKWSRLRTQITLILTQAAVTISSFHFHGKHALTAGSEPDSKIYNSFFSRQRKLWGRGSHGLNYPGSAQISRPGETQGRPRMNELHELRGNTGTQFHHMETCCIIAQIMHLDCTHSQNQFN